MAYFGDATAHAAVLGVAMSLTLSMPIFPGVLFVSLLMAVIVSNISGRGFAMDTLLGVMAHTSLAIGLVAVSFLSEIKIDLMSYLFGDILAVGKNDIWLIAGGAIAVLLLIYWRWNGLLLSTLNPDLALANGYAPKKEQLILTLALAIVVAVAIKVVGALLITAMLIVPAATARPFSKTPEIMVLIAAIFAVGSSVLGLRASFLFDTPTGPTIVCVSAFFFVLTSVVSRVFISLWKNSAKL
jgi:zinc transport system permease protein